VTLADLRRAVLDELWDEWITPTEMCRALGPGNGVDWYRVALVLERLANDGLVELKTAGSTVRRFRRASA
jgi:hypothetical protein